MNMGARGHYYQTLQVDPAAEPEVIQAAYRRLARKYHPDSATPEASEDKMRALNEAYEVLSDPLKRQEYDREIAETDSIRRRQEQAEIDARASQGALMELLLRALSQRDLRLAYGSGSSIRALDGTAVIKAQDGTYLGLISSDRLEADSLANSFGSYGNPYSPISIRNEYGTYGGLYGVHSPFNQYTQTPPVIIKGGRVIAYLTVNPYLKPAISPHDLLSELGIG